ncbi:MAG: RNA-binding cell elongation regulator Jag/EloR [Acidimicrobiales bacterium]|nr:RNA-binding cell elongation regulator Jag/EloR [Acidimicrobiales bacterium]
MEWVETTGKTVEEAKDAALDQLGVDEQDADFEVLEEPRTGLFGRTRGEARVRARVRPSVPRPKLERRDRKGRGRNGKPLGERGKAAPTKQGGSRTGSDRAETPPAPIADVDDPAAAEAGEGPAAAMSTPAGLGGGRRPRGGGRGSRTPSGNGADGSDGEESIQMSGTELAEQAEVVRVFLVDLLDAFGLDGEVTATPAEEGAVELAVTGGDLGLLIGPKGQTLQAIQELSRSALQRRHPGETHARVRVDVAGYRQRRREALERFVRDVAEQVKASGTQKALEPMSPPDRKVVHDTVNEIEGVHTVSEGEDSRRRVVILPG